jgi:hypothetical protein
MGLLAVGKGNRSFAGHECRNIHTMLLAMRRMASLDDNMPGSDQLLAP